MWWLEFRRVLFRSRLPHWPGGVCGACSFVPGQGGSRVRVRPGDLRRRRSAVLDAAVPAAAGSGNGQVGGTADDLRAQVHAFLAAHDPATTDRMEFVRARFDAGLAWVHYPAGLGGQGLPRTLQKIVDAEFATAGAPTNRPERNGIGLGLAAPTILACGSDGQ